MSSYMYIGPNIVQLGLYSGQLVAGYEPNKFLKELIKEKNILASLFVPTSALAVARKNLQVPNSIEWLAYKYLSELSRERIVNLLTEST